VRTTEELLGRKSSGSGLENRDERPWEFVALTTWHPQSAKVGTTSPTSGGRSVRIVHSRTKATEITFSFFRSLRFLDLTVKVQSGNFNCIQIFHDRSHYVCKTIILHVALYGYETWSHHMGEEEVIAGWRKCSNGELHNFCSPKLLEGCVALIWCVIFILI
jgi:hypothetical protein